MAEMLPLPYEVQEVLFTKINFWRAPLVPDPFTVNVNMGVRIIVQNQHAMELGVQITTVDSESPVKLDLELVGKFKATDANATIQREDFEDFISQKGLPVMWPYADALVRQLCGTMSIPLIKLVFSLVIPLPGRGQPAPAETATAPG
jgi:hypothetical protein